MRIRYIFNVHNALRTMSYGPREADAGTLYGAQDQIRLELEKEAQATLPMVALQFDLVAAIALGK